MGAVRRFGVILVAVMICSVVSAGTLTVMAVDGMAPVRNAKVEIEPAGVNGNTNATGKWSGRVPAGPQKVIVWTSAGGTLKAGIVDITMPAGDHDVSVSLVSAIRVQDYYPMAVGNKWQYDYRHSEVGGASYRTTWREEVVRSVMVDGDRAVAIEAQKGATPEWEEIRASNSDGFAMYTQEHGPDTIKFEPPLKIGPLMPLGYEWVATATAHHSDGSPDTPVTFRCKFSRFQDIRVPRGMFRDCARLAAKFEFGADVNELTLWMAEDIGPVREVEKNTERTNIKMLEEYSIRGVAPRPLRPLRPIGPLTPRMP